MVSVGGARSPSATKGTTVETDNVKQRVTPVGPLTDTTAAPWPVRYARVCAAYMAWTRAVVDVNGLQGVYHPDQSPLEYVKHDMTPVFPDPAHHQAETVHDVFVDALSVLGLETDGNGVPHELYDLAYLVMTPPAHREFDAQEEHARAARLMALAGMPALLQHTGGGCWAALADLPGCGLQVSVVSPDGDGESWGVFVHGESQDEVAAVYGVPRHDAVLAAWRVWRWDWERRHGAEPSGCPLCHGLRSLVDAMHNTWNCPVCDPASMHDDGWSDLTPAPH